MGCGSPVSGPKAATLLGSSDAQPPGGYRLSVAIVRVHGVDAPLALYRRYRPDSFADFIGQEHVTGPLRNALAADRVNHAYLFSGPRGCGKTTAARIMARAINCERAPIADPCGECESCRDLARGGPGSIDVIEIDAASHGGVDDARDLREKAFFAPVRSRYKIYIIDEAHMVSTQGFNALLKLVEEPPEHLRFIFATTEPEKVLATIRSRTHHYPFRLYPPKVVSEYVARLCEEEKIAVDASALPLVVRAGGGSMRDTLSVMDQLLGGAGPEGVTYELAAGLLGYTPDALLDEVVDAFAAHDGAAVFGVIDKIIETGQDPRRFTEDLLRRLRDLVIVKAVPDAPATGLIDVSDDGGERLRRPGRTLRTTRSFARRRCGRHRSDRDARRHRPPASARADLCPGAAARCRRCRWSRGSAGPSGEADRDQRYADGVRCSGGGRPRSGPAGAQAVGRCAGARDRRSGGAAARARPGVRPDPRAGPRARSGCGDASPAGAGRSRAAEPASAATTAHSLRRSRRVRWATWTSAACGTT